MLSPALRKKKKRWEIIENDDGTRVKKRINRRGDIITKKITPVPKQESGPSEEKSPIDIDKKYSKEEKKEMFSKAQAIMDKMDGVPTGSTPRDRKKFYGKKKRATRKVERSVIRSDKKKEEEEKSNQPPKNKRNKKIKLKGGKGVSGGRKCSPITLKDMKRAGRNMHSCN